MTTQQKARVTVSVDGVKLPTQIFDSLSDGGGSTATIQKYRPGNMGDEIAEDALPSLDDITVNVGNFAPAAWTTTLKYLRSVNGRAKVVVDEQPIDGSPPVPVGDSTTYTGKLQVVNPGPLDSQTAETRMIAITMSTTAFA